MRRPGDIVGDRYVIKGTLGSGGMATVYRAEHVLSRRPVALKVMHDALNGPGAAERFRREASAAARIGHPGLVTVYDAGVDPDGGAFFLAMELLEGDHLGLRLRRPGTTRRDGLRLVRALLEPLVAAHQAGFVHRDLKPQNVLVGADGTVKLLDLGLAKHRDAKTLTATGNTLGTPHYMAPEQFMNSRDVTPAADVWAAGVVLYEILGGQHPFDAPTPQAVLIRAVTEPPRPLRELVPGLPELAALVDRCLAREPGERPDAATLARALASALEDGPPALDEATSLAEPAEGDATRPVAPDRRGAMPARVQSLGRTSWRCVEAPGYRFFVPPGWTSRDSLVHHVAAKYEAPETSAAGMRPRCVLKVEPFPEGGTQAYLALGLENMTHVGRLYQSVDAELGGEPTIELDGAFPEHVPPFRTLRRAVVRGGVGYVFMCDGPAEPWHPWAPVFRAILDSFSFR
ncbi:MAG: protein kinase [Myxococcota bacterium]